MKKATIVSDLPTVPKLAPSFAEQANPAYQARLIQQLYGTDPQTAFKIATGELPDTAAFDVSEEAEVNMRLIGLHIVPPETLLRGDDGEE